MPISLKNTASILPYVRYSPQVDKMTVAGDDNKPRVVEFINRPFAADPENGTPGWLAMDVGMRDWKPFPLGVATPPSPGQNYKRGFWLLMYAPKMFGTSEALEMCNSSAAHLSFCERLYNETEQGFGRGQVPIIKITDAESIKVGKGKSRELHFEIVKWVPRPAAFTEALAKLKAAAGGAPGKSAGAAADGGDDFDDDDGSVGAGGNDFDDDGGAGGAVVDEPADGSKASAKAGKAKKGRGKAQAQPPKPSFDILDDPINDPIPY